MSDLDHHTRLLAEALQRRAQWHLTAQEWDEYLRTVADLVTLYEHQNNTAARVAHLFGEQGRDILRWVDLANHAQQNLVQAIEKAQDFAAHLVATEQANEQKHLAQLRDTLTRR